MMESDETRADIYAAMIDDDDDGAPASNVITSTENTKNFTTILVNDSKVQVPTLEYVRRLEQTITTQNALLQKLERQLNRVNSLLRNHRSTIHGQANRINDVIRDLDSKIDRRD